MRPPTSMSSTCLRADPPSFSFRQRSESVERGEPVAGDFPTHPSCLTPVAFHFDQLERPVLVPDEKVGFVVRAVGKSQPQWFMTPRDDAPACPFQFQPRCVLRLPF